VNTIFVIGGFIEERYKGNIHKFSHQMNTQDGVSNITLLYFPELSDFLNHLPAQTTLVLIELFDGAQDLKDYQHPSNATYLFGRETTGIETDQLTEIEDYFERLNASVPPEYLEGHKKTAHLHKIKIDTPQSLNVGVCASIVMYDAKNRHAPG
jgi:tRNA(Leu) C34 or U34 (ribose-2'-O)-methylase TrmL